MHLLSEIVLLFDGIIANFILLPIHGWSTYIKAVRTSQASSLTICKVGFSSVLSSSDFFKVYHF